MSYKKFNLSDTEIADIKLILTKAGKNIEPQIENIPSKTMFSVKNVDTDYLEVMFNIMFHKSALTTNNAMGQEMDYKKQNKIINRELYNMLGEMIMNDKDTMPFYKYSLSYFKTKLGLDKK